jgi:hypothetical protein
MLTGARRPGLIRERPNSLFSPPYPSTSAACKRGAILDGSNFTQCRPRPVSIREAARRVNRDVKAVHGDVHVLLDAGVLHKTDDGLVVFPFDAIHIDVMLHAAE